MRRLNKQMTANSENFDWTGIEFPTPLTQIDRFERQNKLAVKVFGYNDEVKKKEVGYVYPLSISKKYEGDDERVINLLLISNNETNHYTWIKNISRLLS